MFWIVFAFRYESQCGYCIFVIKPLFKITQLFAKVKIEGIPMFIEFQLWTHTRTHSERNLNYVAKTSLSSNQGCFAANICRKIWLYRYIELISLNVTWDKFYQKRPVSLLNLWGYTTGERTDELLRKITFI